MEYVETHPGTFESKETPGSNLIRSRWSQSYLNYLKNLGLLVVQSRTGLFVSVEDQGPGQVEGLGFRGKTTCFSVEKEVT
jgi:hypothetical protein